MKPFTYHRAEGVADAVRHGSRPHTEYLGGGTNLVDLMRVTVEQPDAVVDVSGLHDLITEYENGDLSIGAGVTNTALAEHALVRARHPVLARAVVAGASAQIRNMATVGGNIMQRTRCPYFYDVDGSRCNKRHPGQGCDAVEGLNRNHAILGASGQCVATHPSDMCVALAALDALVRLHGPEGQRAVPLTDLHRLPGDEPETDTVVEAGEVITSVELPAPTHRTSSTYRKVRDRSSYAFALVSVAAVVRMHKGRLADVRIALGGVAAKPWRAHTAEQMLLGARATPQVFRAAAQAELETARALRGNAFKIDLARRTMASVLGELTGEAT